METKRIFVLGNGFDLAHYLPTAYVHFMDAMMVVEKNIEDKELGFNDLYEKYLSDDASDRDSKFFQKTKELYKTNNLKLSNDVGKSLQEKLKSNGWFQHFKYHLTDVDTWIDFESEIENVLLNISTLLDKDFEENTIIDRDIRLSSEFPLNSRYMNESEFLGNSSVQFSPAYLKEMKFKSSKIQKILRTFSILSKIYGSCEKVEDYGTTKVHNFKSHDSDSERRKVKENTPKLNSVFIEFEVKNLINKEYLNRFSTFYISFNSKEVYRKLLEDLEGFIVIFREYINLIVNKLGPAKPFDTFGNLAKEINAVYTFNYSNTFERLYPNSLENQLNQVEVQYIHGNAVRKNIVLGISDLDEGKLKEYKIYGFVKTFQKLVSNTDYMFLDNSDVKLTSKPPINYLLQDDYEIII